MGNPDQIEDLIDQHHGIHQRFGDELIILCPAPDHDDSTPSCWVNVKKGLWTCYSCGAGGKVEDILPDGVRLSRSVSLDELVDALKALDGKTLEQLYYPESWLDRYTIWDEAMEYWRGQRGLSEAVVHEFRLGWDPEERAATYPLRDLSGRVLGVVRRFTGGGGPKYKYPRGKPTHELLYAYDRVAREHHRHVVLVEGAMDALALWDAQIPAMAIYGSRISPTQVRVLQRLQPLSITLAFDNDKAGVEATNLVLSSPLNSIINVVDWAGVDAKDVAELSLVERVELVATAKSLLDRL